MRYTAVIAVPTVIEFNSEGEPEHITNQAWALCNNYGAVVLPDHDFLPRLLAVVPQNIPKDAPLVFDPPPMCA